jgi:predicted kinase
MGLPGSGKSTEAQKMLCQNSNLKRVNKDTLRYMLDGEQQDYNTEKRVTLPIRDYILCSLLGKGFDVVVDDTNLKKAYYEQVCRIAQKVGNVHVVVRYFDVPLKECLIRNALRERPVPKDLIERMYKKYIASGNVPFKDAYFPKIKRHFQGDPNLSDAIIVDIDGTAALNQGVRDYYDMSRVTEDDPNEPVLSVVRLEHKASTKVIIVSGRDDIALNDTKLWLEWHRVPYDSIYMRITGDKRKDTVIKKEIYENEIKEKYNVKYVFDDRPEVCRMWRELGLTVFQVQDIEF